MYASLAEINMGRRKGYKYKNVWKSGDTAAQNLLIAALRGERKITYPGKEGNRPPSNLVYVEPFALPLVSGKKLEERVNSVAYPTVSSFVAGFVADTHIAADIVVLDRSISPRVMIVTERSATGTKQTSKFTGNPYKDYGGKGVSVPFGKGSGTGQDTVAEVFKIIRERVKAANVANTCSLVPGLDIA
jgi:hypothetical protein